MEPEAQEQEPTADPTADVNATTSPKKKRSYSPINLASSLLDSSQRFASYVGNGVASGVRRISRDSSPSRTSIVTPAPVAASAASELSLPSGKGRGQRQPQSAAAVPTARLGRPPAINNQPPANVIRSSSVGTKGAKGTNGVKGKGGKGGYSTGGKSSFGKGPRVSPQRYRGVSPTPQATRTTSQPRSTLASAVPTSSRPSASNVGSHPSLHNPAMAGTRPSHINPALGNRRSLSAIRQSAGGLAARPSQTTGPVLSAASTPIPSPRSLVQQPPRQKSPQLPAGLALGHKAQPQFAAKYPPTSPHLFQPTATFAKSDTDSAGQTTADLRGEGLALSPRAARRVSLSSPFSQPSEAQKYPAELVNINTPDSSRESLGERMQSVANSDRTQPPRRSVNNEPHGKVASALTLPSADPQEVPPSNTSNAPKIINVSVNDRSIIKLVVLNKPTSEYDALTSVYKKAGLSDDVAIRLYSSSREAILKWEELINRETLRGITELINLTSLVESLDAKYGSLRSAIATATTDDGMVSMLRLQSTFSSVDYRHFVYPLWSLLSSENKLLSSDLINYLSVYNNITSEMPSPTSHGFSTAAASVETASVKSKLHNIIGDDDRISGRSELESDMTNERDETVAMLRRDSAIRDEFRRVAEEAEENTDNFLPIQNDEESQRNCINNEEHDAWETVEMLGRYLSNFLETEFIEARKSQEDLETNDRSEIEKSETATNSDIQQKLRLLSIETSDLTGRQAVMMLQMQGWASIREDSIEVFNNIKKSSYSAVPLSSPSVFDDSSVWEVFESRLQQRGSGMMDLQEVSSDQIMELAKQFGFDLVDSLKIKSIWRSKLLPEHVTPTRSRIRSFGSPDRTPTRTPKFSLSPSPTKGGRTEIIALDSDLFRTVAQVAHNTAVCQGGTFGVSKILELFEPPQLISEYNIIRKSGAHQKPQMVYYCCNDKPDISELVNYGFMRESSRVGNLTFSTLGEIDTTTTNGWLLLCEILPGNSIRGELDIAVDADSSFTERTYVSDGDVKTEKRFQISTPSRVKPRYAVFPSVTLDQRSSHKRSLTSGAIVYCPIHPKEELRLYCDSEKELTCSLCASVGRHSDKYCKSLTEVIKEMRSGFVQNEKLVGTKIGRLESERIRLQSQQSALTDSYTQAMAALEARAACVHAEVDAYQRLLSDTFKRRQLEISTAISDSSTEANQKLDSLREAQQFLRSLLESNPADGDHGVSQKASEIIALSRILQNDKLKADAAITLNTSLVSSDFMSFYQSEVCYFM